VSSLGRAYLACQALGWSAWAATGVGFSLAFGYASPAMTGLQLLSSAAGAALTHLLRHLVSARGWLSLPWPRLLPRLLASAVLLALALLGIALVAGVHLFGVYQYANARPGIMLVSFANWMLAVLLWLSLYLAVRYFRDWRRSEIARLELEVAARQVELDALQAQLNPHFLFNALNSLRALIAERPERARELVTELADLLRYALQAGRRSRVPLAEELAVVRSYLQVESVRLEERLSWRVEADDDVAALALPPMLVQLLVENAVKHGIATRPQGGEVTVTARRQGGRLEVRVANSGALEPATPGEGGLGLANARGRLRLLYGDRATLELSAPAPDAVEARLRLPAEAA
jgi:sensor histidine kinase YesM